MKKSLKWILILTVFIAAIVAVYFAYGALSEKYAPDRITQIGGNDKPQTEEGTKNDSGDDTPEENGTNQPDNETSRPDNSDQSESGSKNESTEENINLAPDFTVLDKDGNEVKLSDYFGKPIVLNFWASWCYYCTLEMPDFEAAYKNNPDIQFLMVNVTDGDSETVESAKKFIETNGYTFPVFFDTELEAASTYGASGLPMTFFISASGELTAYGSGMLSAEDLEYGISMIK